MKKFFKFGSSKKSTRNLEGPKSPHRRSLVSIASSVSDSEYVGLGSFSSSVDPNKGYQVEFGRDKSLTKLHKACWTGDLDNVKKYLKKLDINQVDCEFRTPLHFAATRAHKDVIWYLLGSKAKPNLPDIDGNTPLLKAVQCGHADIVQFLLERGADPKASDNNGNTGLHHAAWDGQQDIAFSLLQKGADINAKNKDGASPLMISTTQRQVDMTELLLRHGASLSVSDMGETTCLMVACKKGYSELVQIFVQHGVDENARNNSGHTAEDIAKFAGHAECVSVLNNFRLKRNSSKNDPQEYRLNETISTAQFTNDVSVESDDHSRASQVDLNADFNDSDIDSWNDDASETSFKKDSGAGVNLSKFMKCDTEELFHSEASGINLNVKNLESLKEVSQDINAEEKAENKPITDSEMNAGSKENEETVADVPLVYENESDELLTKSVVGVQHISDAQLRKNRDLLEDLGLEDGSEVSTPTFSEFSMKDENHKDADTDVEDDNIKFDYQEKLSVAEGPRELPLEASLLNVSAKENIDVQATDSSSFGNKESNAPLTSASQNIGSLQTVYFNVKKDGSIDGGDSDTDWDDESKEEGPIHIHPIILQKIPKDESSSNEIFKKNDQEDQSLPLSQVPSEQSATEHKLDETNDDPYPLLIEISKNVRSNVTSNQGTLGRPGTMHEVEEIWVENPSLEIHQKAIRPTATHQIQSFEKNETKHIVKEMAKSFMEKEVQFAQQIAKNDVQPIIVKDAHSLVKNDSLKDMDNIYRAEPVLVNSQETSRSNTLDGHQNGNFNQVTQQNDAGLKNSEVIPMEQLWDQIWLQFCGNLKKENDTESSDEISSVAITDQENRDSSFSSADVDQSVASTQDDVLPYHLLASFLKDPNCSKRVIDLIHHLRLSCLKEQDKSKVLVQKIKLLKSEAQVQADKNILLNVSKVDAENAVYRLETNLEAEKHALKIQENLRSSVELELDQCKNQLLALEENFMQEVAARQQAELLSKANIEEVKTNHDLMIQMSTQIPKKSASLADFGCQTDESTSNDNQKHDLEMILLKDEKAKLEGELLSLKQQMDSQALSLAQKSSQHSNLEDQLDELQKELILKTKALTQSDESLAEINRKYSARAVNEDMLNKKLEELHKDYLRISSEVVTSGEQNVQLSKNLAIASNNLDECNLKIALLEQEIQTVKAKEDRLQMSLKLQIHENELQKQEITDLQKRLSLLQSDKYKVQFEVDNGNKLQQLILDQEKTQNQIIKAKEEKYVAIVKENEALKNQIEDFKEQELLNVQKMNVLTEKLLQANSIKTEVCDLESQLAISSNKLSFAESKIGELKKKLQEEQTAGLQFLTVEKELDETSKKLNLANTTITTIENLLAVAQENKINQDSQLQKEFQGARLQLQDANNKIKDLCNELDVKDKAIQDLTSRLEHHIKTEDPQHPTNSTLSLEKNKNQRCLGKDCTNVENGKIVSNQSQRDMAIDFSYNQLEDANAVENKEWQEFRDGIMPSFMFSKYDEALEKLQKQVEELKKQSVKENGMPFDDRNIPGISNTDGQQPVHILTAESPNHQMNLLGNSQQDVRQQKGESLKHVLQMQNIHNRIDESAKTLKNTVDDVDIEFMRQSWEVGARRELNQQLEKINKFLEERSHANDHLEELHKEREIRLHRNYQRAVRDLQIDVHHLHDELEEKESSRKALKEQNRHRHKLNEARKRVKAKLQDHSKQKTCVLDKHLCANHSSRLKEALFASSSQEYGTSSLTSFHGLSPSMPGSPIINNLKSVKDLPGFDREPIVPQQLSGSSAFDNLYKSNINVTLDKTTSEYLDALKKNYLL